MRGSTTRSSVAIVVLAFSLVGCTSGPSDSVPTASASGSVSDPPAVDTSTWIGGVIDPAGTTWAGTDSAGETTVLALNDDHTVDVTYGAASYSDPNDTWTVVDEALGVEVFIDAARGVARYTATWDEATSVLTASATTTVSGETLTVALTQQR